MKRTLSVLALLLALVFLPTCGNKADPHQTGATTVAETTATDITPPEKHPQDDPNIDASLAYELRTAYRDFCIEKLHSNYYTKENFDLNDVYVRSYYGTYSDCPVVWMVWTDLLVTQAERSVSVGGYILHFTTGSKIYIYHNRHFYTIEEAYNAQLITGEDVYQIGLKVSFRGVVDTAEPIAP